jgi:hypothetical protein
MNGTRGTDSSLRHHEASDLVLYVAGDQPTDPDRRAEDEVRAFDPNVEVRRIEAATGMSTPQLLAGRSFYRGLASIRAFIEQEKDDNRLQSAM